MIAGVKDKQCFLKNERPIPEENNQKDTSWRKTNQRIQLEDIGKTKSIESNSNLLYINPEVEINRKSG
tara:strand:+ start:567 stop:770 length:204 start_codon:yes stop_codon:yes gene_type:complete